MTTVSSPKVNKSNIILYIIGIPVILCVLCFGCMFVYTAGQQAGIFPTNVPTLTPDKSITAVQTAAIATYQASQPTKEHIQPTSPPVAQVTPSSTPLPETPAPTPIAIIPLDLSQFMDAYNSLTDMQKEDFKKQYTGQWVSWSGKVFDVKSDSTIDVNIPNTLVSLVILGGVSHADAIQVSKNSTISFIGHIKDINDLLGMHIYLDHVQLIKDGSPTNMPSPNIQPAPTSAPASVQIYKIGDIVQVGNVTVVLNSANLQGGKLSANFTIENKGSKDLAVSSLLSFSAKDSEGTKLDQDIIDCGTGSLDGKVLPGDKLKGNICYGGVKTSNAKIYYEAELFSSGAVVWQVP